MKDSITGYILVGGESSRMGQPKGNLKLKGLSFIEHLDACLNHFCEKIYLVGNKEDYDHLGIERIKDQRLNIGPISGMQSALNHSSTDWNFILSCDIPTLDSDTLNHLIPRRNSKFKAHILKGKFGLQPLIGLYHKAILNSIENQIYKGDFKISNLLKRVSIEEVEGLGGKEVLNINTKEEYKRLRDEFEN